MTIPGVLRPRLLTKRERSQLERAVALVEKIHEESADTLGLSSDEAIDAPVAGSAKHAEIRLSALLDEDERERERWESELERARFEQAFPGDA